MFMTESLESELRPRSTVNPDQRGGTAEAASKIRLGSPADLLSAIPYLVGFHPQESVVLVGIAGSEVRVTARLDLVDCGIEELTHALVVMTRAAADAVVAVVYCHHAPHPQTGFDVLGRDVFWPLLDAAGQFGLRLGECLVVGDERYWRFGDGDTVGIAKPTDSALAASATYAGLVVRPDRNSLVAVLDAADATARSALSGEIADAQAQAALAARSGGADRHIRSIKRAIFAAARLSDSTLAVVDDSPARAAQLCRFGVGLSHTRVRDSVWMAVDSGRLDGRSLWQEMLRKLPEPYDCAALFLFGWASWRDGNGVLATEAALRALASDPGYTAAELLLSAVDSGLDPHRTPRLRLPGRKPDEGSKH